ncbi:ATP-binding protein [Streptomyces taklimakanensis]|uniref:ATP-binding protein n=1 Tax=Streptomyces taklimakanensis TaxID=2569853 RepID=UPI00192E384C|nr:ATP-binding protein [Streptomyces taklimakanensis]
MKQRTKKTIGVAVLGAAFAAAGAGTAGAAEPLRAGETAGGLLKALPVQEVAETLPSPEQQARTLPAKPDAKQGGKGRAESRDPVRELLGGLPLGALGKQPALDLPTGPVTGALTTGGLVG